MNYGLWDEYNKGNIDREAIRKSRFKKIFEILNADISFSLEISEYYISNCSIKTHLMPDAKVALDYLISKYKLHIITNGFNDVQFIKLRKSGIVDYFDAIVTSENAKSRKPNPEIYSYAMNQAACSANEAIMIGDNPMTDIKGAKDYGIETVLYNPSGKVKSLATYTIQSHMELLKIF